MPTIQDLDVMQLSAVVGDDGKIKSIINERGVDMGVVTASADPVTGGIGNRGVGAQSKSGSKTLTTQYDIGSLPAGFVIPHRGPGALIGPQKTWAGYETGLAIGRKMGAPILDVDVKALSDGFVIWHDNTWDAYSTASGAVSNTPSSAARNIVVDCSSTFGGGSTNQVGVCFADEFFVRYAGKCCFSVEPKDAASAAYLVNLLSDLGIKDACLVNSFTASFLAPFLAAGFPHVLLNITSGVANSAMSETTIQEYVNAGYAWVGLPWDSLVANGSACKAKGLKVLVTTPSRRYQRDLWSGIYDCIASDDPMYIAGLNPVRATDSWRYNSYGHGIQNLLGDESPTLRGFFDAGRFRRNLTAESKWWCLIGEVELPPAFTMTMKIRTNGAAADTTKPIGIMFCSPTDHAFNRSLVATDNGYYATIAPNGGLTLRRYTAGVQANVKTGTAAAMSADADVTATVTVNDTTVTFTVGGVTLSVTDAEHRGKYMFIGCENAATVMSVSFSDLSVAAA